MKRMSEWKGGDAEPAIFAVALLVLIIIVAALIGHFVPGSPINNDEQRSRIVRDP